MSDHATIETISAYLDGEVGKHERIELEEHFASCDRCTADRGRLERGMRAVRALASVEPTSDESRAIKRAVLEKTSRGPGFKWTFTRTWALAGAAALVVAGIFGYFATSRFSRQTADTAAIRQAAPAGAEAPFVFDSPEQLRDAVLANPEVKEGLDRYRVKDVGTLQQQALASLEQNESAVDATARGISSEAKAVPAKTLSSCLREVLRGQPFPVMPILARDAVFQGTPAYLLIYAYTVHSDDENARLNLVQSWVVDQAACTPLNFQQLDPKKPVPK